MSGGFLSNLSSSALAAYPQTLQLTLVDDTWSDALMGADAAATTALLDGLRSLQSETFGFNSVVAPVLDATAVAVTSMKHATVTLPVVPR